ncbi:hypothetical protein CDD83_8234 [Cordyceps sp. RAO-2017]|nr:hypothetical protein CDD83_8234 [Cordyceps sp. RAO-2017]
MALPTRLELLTVQHRTHILRLACSPDPFPAFGCSHDVVSSVQETEGLKALYSPATERLALQAKTSTPADNLFPLQRPSPGSLSRVPYQGPPPSPANAQGRKARSRAPSPGPEFGWTEISEPDRFDKLARGDGPPSAFFTRISLGESRPIDCASPPPALAEPSLALLITAQQNRDDADAGRLLASGIDPEWPRMDPGMSHPLSSGGAQPRGTPASHHGAAGRRAARPGNGPYPIRLSHASHHSFSDPRGAEASPGKAETPLQPSPPLFLGL